jgi:hypothetical protein
VTPHAVLLLVVIVSPVRHRRRHIHRLRVLLRRARVLPAGSSLRLLPLPLPNRLAPLQVRGDGPPGGPAPAVAFRGR